MNEGIGENSVLNPESEAKAKKRKESAALLRKAVKEYKDSPHTPDSVKEYWQTRWKVYGDKVGMEITVPPCDRSEEEVKKLESLGRKLIYVPKELTTPEGLILLGKMHPKMGFLPYKSADIVSEGEVSGWLDVEAAATAPKRDTTETELREQFKKEGRIGMNLQTYIIASQDSKDLTGKYFDEKLLCRLLGSSKGETTISAHIDSSDDLRIDLVQPDMKNEQIGGRSMGIKKAPLTS